ncbi:MAG: diguanylate cyclase, partial [Gammaproteobacteria bacterium]|nr:diguanylate cyclase [Gammaproteobacteria bacterium]
MADVDSVRAVVSFIGITNQLVGTILLFCLFSVLLEKSERRLYFVMWRRAWAALMIALIALFPIVAFQSGILDATGPRWWQPLSLVIYLVGKLGFLLYLVAGVLIYSGATNIRKYFPPAIALVLVYSVVTYIFSANYYQTVIWQSPLYVAAMSYSGFVLFNLPKPRRSRGTQFTAIVLLFSALIWILYLVAFKESIVDGVISTETPFGILVRMNNYAELFIAVLMAFGMIRILHETDLRDLRSAQSDLSVANQSLKREVLLDPLTGIYNRRAFDEGTGLEAARVTFGAVAVLDVDDLKKINDKFGHAAGDEL